MSITRNKDKVSKLLIANQDIETLRAVQNAATAAGFVIYPISETESFSAVHAELQPSVIFYNLSWPGMDGIELIGWLEENHHTADVFLTSDHDPFFLKAANELAKAKGLTNINVIDGPITEQKVSDLLATRSAKPRICSLLREENDH